LLLHPDVSPKEKTVTADIMTMIDFIAIEVLMKSNRLNMFCPVPIVNKMLQNACNWRWVPTQKKLVE